MKFRSASLAASIAILMLPASTGLAAEEAAAAMPAKIMKAPKAAETKCELRTGSRIPPKKADNCSSNHPWRSYSKQEIDTTGYIDVAEALRKLDPVFQ